MKKVFFIAVLSFVSIRSQAQKKAVPDSYMLVGKETYTKYCMTCHQVDGTGAQNMIPPLIKTDYVLGDTAPIIKILLNGMSGEVKINGDIYAGEMPSHAFLTDDEIAAVLTYVRNSFGNKASAVTSNEIKSIRATLKK